MGAEEGRRSSGVRHRAGVPSRFPEPSSPAPAQGPSRVGDQRLRHPHGPKDTHRGSQCSPCPPRGDGAAGAHWVTEVSQSSPQLLRSALSPQESLSQLGHVCLSVCLSVHPCLRPS